MTSTSDADNDGHDGHTEYESPAPRADEADLERVAGRFVSAWLNPAGGHQVWLQRLRPLSEQALAQGLESTDLAHLPTATVRGSAEVLYATHRDALVRVPTTAGNLTVVLVRTSQAAAAPVRTAVPSPTPTSPTSPVTPVAPVSPMPDQWLVRSLAPERG